MLIEFDVRFDALASPPRLRNETLVHMGARQSAPERLRELFLAWVELSLVVGSEASEADVSKPLAMFRFTLTTEYSPSSLILDVVHLLLNNNGASAR